MSRLECRVCEDLHKIFKGNVVRQKEVDRFVFNAKGKYKADFYLPDLDLYIEVKGLMTTLMINKALYSFAVLKDKFYLFHGDNEDWVGECTGKSRKDCKKKIDEDYEFQLQEFRDAVAAKDKVKAAQEISRKSFERLKQYLLLRGDDMNKWMKEYEAKYGVCSEFAELKKQMSEIPCLKK